MMKILERELAFHFKLTWGISHILTQALRGLKKIYLNGLLLSQVYIIWAKITEEWYFVKLKSDAKFHEKRICGLENDRDFSSFH